MTVISDVGISVNTVPDFRTLRKGNRSLFDISAYNNARETENFHIMIHKISRLSAQATPTTFHKFLNKLADEGRLLRYYTQNIDYIELQLYDL